MATFSEIQTVREKAVVTYFKVPILNLSEWAEANNESAVKQDIRTRHDLNGTFRQEVRAFAN
jgi:hypothetical protein